jgi:transposase
VAGWRIDVEFERWRVYCPRCRAVFVEQLDWLAKNPRYTRRYAMHVGALCREMTNKAVAELEHLHDSTVKDLDKVYMQLQVERAGPPAPRAIGVDEISVRKGHDYRVIVSDLDQRDRHRQHGEVPEGRRRDLRGADSARGLLAGWKHAQRRRERRRILGGRRVSADPNAGAER